MHQKKNPRIQSAPLYFCMYREYGWRIITRWIFTRRNICLLVIYLRILARVIYARVKSQRLKKPMGEMICK